MTRVNGALLAVVIASSRQTWAYPNSGGAHTVARPNLGEMAGLAAVSARLVDYVPTVAVSVAPQLCRLTGQEAVGGEQ